MMYSRMTKVKFECGHTHTRTHSNTHTRVHTHTHTRTHTHLHYTTVFV